MGLPALPRSPAWGRPRRDGNFTLGKSFGVADPPFASRQFAQDDRGGACGRRMEQVRLQEQFIQRGSGQVGQAQMVQSRAAGVSLNLVHALCPSSMAEVLTRACVSGNPRAGMTRRQCAIQEVCGVSAASLVMCEGDVCALTASGMP